MIATSFNRDVASNPDPSHTRVIFFFSAGFTAFVNSPPFTD
jgi:hypothetical protein